MSDKPLRHEHLLIQAYIKKPIMDEEIAKKWLSDLIEKVGMKLAAGPVAHFVDTPGNEGITAAACLMTSHCSIHFWSNLTVPLAQMDIYSCSEVDLNVVFDHFAMMEPISLEYKFLNRDGGFKTISEGTKTFE
jgi:S-adenosylmethionine/arginine decarboxylase-like enzyme